MLEQNAITQVTFAVQTWTMIEVDRPTILQPTYANLDDSIYGGNFASELFFSPARQGFVLGGSFQARISCNGGVCFLDRPGKWWVYNQNTIYAYPCLLIDASNPSVADYYTSPIVGNVTAVPNAQSGTGADVTYTVGQSAVVLLNNWYRTGWVIQNSANAASRLRVYTGATNASATRGIVLNATGTISSKNFDNPRERVTIWADTGSPTCSITQQFI